MCCRYDETAYVCIGKVQHSRQDTPRLEIHTRLTRDFGFPIKHNVVTYHALSSWDLAKGLLQGITVTALRVC